MKFEMPYRDQNSNKGTFGKILAFCGSDNYIGASYLACLSSLKIGAGLCALASTKEVISSVSKMIAEIVYLDRNQGLKNIDNYNIFLIGCGLGLKGSSERLFKDLMRKLQKETKPIVIDADGLNLLAKTKTKLDKNSNVILTPHPLEASRLLNCSLEEVLEDLEVSAKKITEKYQAITVLKTHRTVVCNKDFSIHINQHGNSALAKAGSGDVLAGVIAGLLAQGMDSFEAAKLGVYIHSRAGEIASEELTEYCVLASEVINFFPKVIKELLSNQ